MGNVSVETIDEFLASGRMNVKNFIEGPDEMVSDIQNLANGTLYTLTSELIDQQHDVEDLIDLLGASLDAIGNVMIATTTAGMRLNKEKEEGRE